MKNIPKPESQIQEVLYELYNRIYIDRKTMMLSCSVLNLTAQISRLRNKGLEIKSEEVSTMNKFGRVVSFVQYKLNNKPLAREIYLSMKNEQSKN